ncbi:MAG: hypothetical protein ACRD2E_06040 [Terriglobales bacterium]
MDGDGGHWLLETKGQETADVPHKGDAAGRWCEEATALTGESWRYARVPQKDFEALRPTALADLAAIDSPAQGLSGNDRR